MLVKILILTFFIFSCSTSDSPFKQGKRLGGILCKEHGGLDYNKQRSLFVCEDGYKYPNQKDESVAFVKKEEYEKKHKKHKNR